MWRWRVCSEISLSEPGLGVWRQQTSLAALSWALRGAQSVLRDRERSLAQSTLHRGQWASSAPAGWKTNRFVRLLLETRRRRTRRGSGTRTSLDRGTWKHYVDFAVVSLEKRGEITMFTSMRAPLLPLLLLFRISFCQYSSDQCSWKGR